MEQLADKIVVITGAGNGIGKAVAQVFARAGCRLALADIEIEAVQALAAQLRELGAEAVPLAVDVTKSADVTRLAEEVEARLGGAHILINNAGVALPGPGIADLAVEDWRWILDVNLMGVIRVLHAFLPMLKAAGEAHVVNMASMTAFEGSAYNAPYCASKAAVLSLSESLAREMAAEGRNIAVSAICPAAVLTTIGRSQARRTTDYGPTSPSIPMPASMSGQMAMSRAALMPPEAIAEQIIAAVRDRRFYVLTHSGSAERARRRVEAATSADGAIFGSALQQ